MRISRANHVRLSSAVSSYGYLTNQLRAVESFAPHPKYVLLPNGGRTPEFILDWARGTLRSGLDACAPKTLIKKDGTAMVDLALYFDDPSAFLSEMCVWPALSSPAVRTRLTKAAAWRPRSSEDMTPGRSSLRSYTDCDA